MGATLLSASPGSERKWKQVPSHLVRAADPRPTGMNASLLDFSDPLLPPRVGEEVVALGRNIILDPDLGRADPRGPGREVDFAAGEDALEDGETIVRIEVIVYSRIAIGVEDDLARCREQHYLGRDQNAGRQGLTTAITREADQSEGAVELDKLLLVLFRTGPRDCGRRGSPGE